MSDKGAQQTAFVSTAGGYVSASDKRVRFGVGPQKKVQLIEIAWPSGTAQKLESIAADQIVTIRESSR